MMEGALQSVKAFLSALASQLRSLIKDQIDSTTANINQVRESMTEALVLWERFYQRIERIEEVLSKISSDVQLGTEKNVEERSESFQTMEVVLPCRRENNDEEEESEVDDLNSAMGSSNRIQLDSIFQRHGKVRSCRRGCRYIQINESL
ncbi:microtubule-associated protein TORTIFOLIA1 [Brassica napus]|nr:PREDICTED: microtubule-associated protein TORTIFOLIA1-like [Brassica oleracea var. oleracea]XP_013670589.1 microtubule-associated protein TORTIFOLIA1 [Brassica napus]